MEQNQSNNKQLILPGKRCEICKVMRPKKNSIYCYRCDPNRNLMKYSMPSFNKLSTLKGIRKAYGNLLNALRKHKIGRDEASAMFYGLNSFIKAMKDLLDMKVLIEKEGGDNRSLITDVKIEQMKMLINKMEVLHNKFTSSNTPTPSGEITQVPQTLGDTDI